MEKDKMKNSEVLDDPGRRHSSADPTDRSALNSASESRLPLRILARSMIPNSVIATSSGSPVPAVLPPAIDVKFIQMYVKKLRPEYRQNSDPTFNRKFRPRQRSSDTTATNSGPSSSSLASSNDDFLLNTPHRSNTGTPRSTDHPKSMVIIPSGKRAGPLQRIRRSASGNDLKETSRKIDDLSLDEEIFSIEHEPVVTCYRILESLFAGGADAVSNPVLLCRLKIDHVIDLRPRSRSNELRPRSRSDCKMAPKSHGPRSGDHGSPVTATEPSLLCVCPDWRHKRQLVHLGDTEGPSASLIENFKRMNSLITNARVRGEKTLVFDEDGRGMAPAAVIEYLMYYYRMTYSAARAFVSGIISDAEIPEPVERALLQWQEELGETSATDHSSMTACSYHQSTPELEEGGSPLLAHKKILAWT